MQERETPNGDSGSAPEEDKAERHIGQASDEEQPVPLFLRDSSEGRKGNAQDEKDAAGE